MALIVPTVAQADALAYLSQSRHLKRGIVVLPTGVGKTIMAALDTLQARANRILFLVHRERILEQAEKEFRKARGDELEKYGYVTGNRKDFDAEIILSTVQTASKPKNLDKLAKIPFDYVIVDECHHANAPSYLRVLEALDAKFILGLTATDFRGDGKKVPVVFGDNVIYRMALKEAIERKLVVPVLYYGLYDNIDYSKIKFGRYGYRENDLNKTLIIDERDRAIIERFKEKCGARQAIGFCASVKHVHSMVDKFNKAGISAVGVTYGMDKASRKKRFDDFAAGHYRVLFAKDILNEGVDFPFVGAVLFLRPTYSKTIFLQQLGRGLRKAEGKENVITLDFIGNSEKADLVREAMKAEGLLETPVEPKPELKYDVSQVYFEEKVVDVLRLLDEKRKKPLKAPKLPKRAAIHNDAILDDLRRLHAEYGEITVQVVKDHGIFAMSTIVRRFGSLNKAVLAAGLPVAHTRNISEDELLDELRRVFKEKGRVTAEILRNFSKYSHVTYIKRFGSLTTALIKAGLPLGKRTNKSISEDELLDELRRVFKEKGRVTAEILRVASKYSVTTYVRKFGNLKTALIKAGLPVSNKGRPAWAHKAKTTAV